jgi:alpha-galactosidase
MAVKISIIGAGSAVFSMSLINDMVRTPGLADSTISFMDIDKDRLDTAYLLCKRYADERGIRLTLEKTTDRRQSIKGADFVINTALAGSHSRLREGWDVARTHGYRFGGSLHIIHDEAFWVNYYQLRLMEDVVKDILELAPKAWFVLVANPVQAGTTYLKRKYPQLNMVGMCHGSNGVYGVTGRMGMEREHVTFECPGVNHFVWLTKLFYKGVDALPALDKWVNEKSEEMFKTCGTCCHEGPKPVDLYRRFGAFPIGDTATQAAARGGGGITAATTKTRSGRKTGGAGTKGTSRAA